MVREYAIRAKWEGGRLSPADLWVFPMPDNIGMTIDSDDGRLVVRRGGQVINQTIELAGDWKHSEIAWRASSWYGLRQGVKSDPLSRAEKQSRGIGEDSLALVIKNLAGRGGPKVQAAGLRVGDVIVAMDGETKAMSESEFLARLRLGHGPQDSVTLTVLREDKRLDFKIPMW
jgi:hypothetical protein